ncbi:hypothetical protein ISN45_At02g020290 [Arabidopsis thaliana x Arabidopsis arenosa]|jgi:hypothetical protein|uniref:Uncharacterized protein n=2 Tax=Arabidopsis TaxID=3701 RepID=A0A8T2G0G6_ARASU|nr:hypothetical protein ISN45_At02g020290 [Arabidopsis thaliana x Arabidopsis arenosa]KAG7642115.1 hypothetical protein ISN44_As02g020710 [Arabidopsis suecica]
MGALRRRNVGLIDSKGCSKLFPVLQSPPLTTTSMSQSNGPFSSLVICVTGLSKGKDFVPFSISIRQKV